MNECYSKQCYTITALCFLSPPTRAQKLLEPVNTNDWIPDQIDCQLAQNFSVVDYL